MTMILRSAPASPFGRKVKIAASVTGAMSSLSVVDADTMDDADSIRRENPLGKIPALIIDDGTTLYDSRVIVDYLDHLSGGMLIPKDAPARFLALTRQALCDGMTDAALLIVYESRFRDESERSARWVAHQEGKIARGLAALEASPPVGTIDIGYIAAACALGYFDLRLGGTWRDTHPALVAWLDAFAAKIPAFEKTRFRQL
ncbi:glutathione S-transferase family protein [Lichenihabitans sp. PAMC28606]|uniref:glutathione S-transferase family protein n=1 Tax=Lichenihabitans sp. PAMC28606 TaxID=2880932 RepID=UPI0029CAB68F|nr:glutathione S-transferase family protein [Lichenihabitans sp. PAMC28606]